MGFLVVLAVAYGTLCPWVTTGSPMQHFFRNTFSLEGLFYFCVGLAAGIYPQRWHLPRMLWALGLALSLMAFGVTLYGEQAAWAWYPYPRWAALPLCLLCVWQVVPESDWFPKIVQESPFPVYVMHVITIYLWALMLKHLPAKHFWNDTLLGYWTRGGIVIGATLLASGFLHWRFPKLAKTLFGGR